MCSLSSRPCLCYPPHENSFASTHYRWMMVQVCYDQFLLNYADFGVTGIIHGDSGAWVVNDSSLEVHGHIVAGDAFGEVYVVPLWDTFDDIKREMNAMSVSLATSVDVLCHASDIVEKNARSSEKAGKDTSTLNLKGSLYACSVNSPVEKAQPSFNSFDDPAKMSPKASSGLPIQRWGHDLPLRCKAYEPSPNQTFGTYPYGAHGPTLPTNQPHNQSPHTHFNGLKSSLTMCLGRRQPYRYPIYALPPHVDPPLAYPPHGIPDSPYPLHEYAPLPVLFSMPISQPDSGYASNACSQSGSPVPLGQSCSPPKASTCGPRPAASPSQSGQPRRQMPESSVFNNISKRVAED